MAVYKDERKNGKWRYRKQVTNPRTDEKKTLSKRGFTTKGEAIVAESIAVAEFINLASYSLLPFPIIISDYIDYKEKRLTTRSMQKIERAINNHILPEVKDFDMRSFSALQARKFYDDLLVKKISNNLKNYVVEQMKAIFRFAERMYNLDSNPVSSFDKLRIRKNKKYHVYNLVEFNLLDKTFSMENDYELSYRIFFNILFFGGPRRGEAKAIRWNDIDFKTKQIRIDEQFIDKDPIHGRIACELKTESSYRSIKYDNTTFKLLKLLYEIRTKNPEFKETDFLFLGYKSDLPFSDNAISKRCKKHALAAGLVPLNPHGYRHSFASVAHSLGADLKTISNQLGHSNLTTTLDIYVSMFDSKNDERVDRLNEARNAMNEL